MTTLSRRRALSAILAAILAAGAGSPAAAGRPSENDSARPNQNNQNKATGPASMTARERALHVLNRLGFGPRPGDAERVAAIGVTAWIERQLSAEGIPDPQIDARLAGLPTLAMSSQDLFATFEKPLREARRLRNATRGSAGAGAGGIQASGGEAANESDATAEEAFRRAIPPEKRPRRIIEELSAARVLRAAYSERQLNEVLVDFWMNHFNVFAAKGLDRVFITSFERDAVRPRIWGRFEDLLLATAKSPAMLVYLDNAQSVSDPEHRPAPARGRLGRLGRFGAFAPERTEAEGMERNAAAGASRRPPGGLNENYAREILELHTLGVDGGYTQTDVTELARVLTGWSVDRARGEFLFRERVHDAGRKTVLGHTFSGGGIDEGEAIIRILARHPATAHHIALELCRRLVADRPPAALVERVAKTFLATDGDLRRTVRAVVESPEFFSPDTYRAKVKSPFEYVVSAVRASGGETDARAPLLREIARMGEPLYLCQPPTGYSDDGAAWVNTGALVARLNFALALSANKLPGTRVDVGRFLPGDTGSDPARSVDAMANALVGGDLAPETRRTIDARLKAKAGSAASEDPSDMLATIAGLILGSPEFQRQ